MARSFVPAAFEVGHPAGRLGADPFALLHREMNRLFDDALQGRQPLAPCVNVSETGDGLRVEAELPGVAEDHLQIDLVGDVLTIRGEKRAEYPDAHHHVVERSFGAFSRSLRLPYAPDPEQVRASVERGVLTVTLPKAAPERRSHRIPVRAQAPSRSPREATGAAAAAGHPTPETTSGSGEADEVAGHPT